MFLVLSFGKEKNDAVLLSVMAPSNTEAASKSISSSEHSSDQDQSGADLVEARVDDDNVKALLEIMPHASSVEVGQHFCIASLLYIMFLILFMIACNQAAHCLAVSGGDVDAAAQLMFYRQETGDTIPSDASLIILKYNQNLIFLMH